MFSNIIEIIILSIVQGISEFLPISSSAHLNIVEIIFEFNSNSLMIDVSLHLGSLLAIVFYFRRELLDLRNNQKLLSLLVIGSILPLPKFIFLLNLFKFLMKTTNDDIKRAEKIMFGIYCN